MPSEHNSILFSVATHCVIPVFHHSFRGYTAPPGIVSLPLVADDGQHPRVVTAVCNPAQSWLVVDGGQHLRQQIILTIKVEDGFVHDVCTGNVRDDDTDGISDVGSLGEGVDGLLFVSKQPVVCVDGHLNILHSHYLFLSGGFIWYPLPTLLS